MVPGSTTTGSPTKISPPWITETLVAFKMDPSWGIPADDAAKAYVAAVEGTDNGQVLDCRRFL